MLLLYPPVAKPSEPPAGIALLAGNLLANNHSCIPVDLNIEGLLFLLGRHTVQTDTWSKRAFRNREKNLENIRSRALYNNFARYEKIVLELNRLLEKHNGSHATASLANYNDSELSPLRSDDLLRMAQLPARSLFYSFFQKKLPHLLEWYSPKYIGISINYLSQALNAFALIGLIKKLAPEIRIIAGGGLITSWMRGADWRDPFRGLIDVCIDGCGVKPLLDLLQSATRQESLPRYDLLPLDDYFAPGLILPYSSSRGCFWNKCSFCPERAEGNPYRSKNIESVLADLSSLRQKTSPSLLHLLDNAIPPALLKRFSKEVPGMPWYGFVRISHHFLVPEFCQNLRKSGCIMLKLGIESADQDVLDKLEKGINISEVSQILKNLKNAGIATYIYLLFGTPAEGRSEAARTLEFTIQHRQEISFLNLAIFNMPLHSQDNEIIKTSSFYAGDLSLYTDFAHPQGWNRKEVRTFLDREFKRQPAIATILRRDPPIFTSNHAPFFCFNTAD